VVTSNIASCATGCALARYDGQKRMLREACRVHFAKRLDRVSCPALWCPLPAAALRKSRQKSKSLALQERSTPEHCTRWIRTDTSVAFSVELAALSWNFAIQLSVEPYQSLRSSRYPSSPTTRLPSVHVVCQLHLSQARRSDYVQRFTMPGMHSGLGRPFTQSVAH
jgi:hypothetical protein